MHTQKEAVTITRYRDRVMSCWLGKAVGGTLGMPFECQDGPFDVDFYTPIPTEMLPNDDLDLQVLWACLLDKMDDIRVDRHILATGWRDHCEFPWDEYGVALRNIAEGLTPPQTGSFDNWFTRGMGAAIRSELWACLAPGDPALAAKYAYEDACVDHDGEGIWAEVFLAALQSAAFSESDPGVLLDAAEAALPVSSEVRQAVHDTRVWWRESPDWLAVRTKILEHWGHENATDVVMNLAVTVLSWLAGEGDFSRTICIATNCGKDTDCTAATVGALLGILDPDCIPDRWLAPIGRDLMVSREIVGIHPPNTLDGFTDLVLDLRTRLAGRAPDAHSTALPLDDFEFPADIGFLPLLPEAGSDAPPMPHTHTRRRLPGTFAGLPHAELTGEVLLLRLTFTLPIAREVDVMFNTPEACRVWIDGVYAFGRDGGVMAPSPHRCPPDQSKMLVLEAGSHSLLAAVRRPFEGRNAEWVALIADPETKQLLPGVFREGVPKLNRQQNRKRGKASSETLAWPAAAGSRHAQTVPPPAARPRCTAKSNGFGEPIGLDNAAAQHCLLPH